MAPRVITALNGRLPTSLLVRVGTDAYGRPARFRYDAAESWVRMLAAGMPMDVSDTYRDLERQWAYYRNPPNSVGLASVPGRSWHGEGMAVDARGGTLAWLQKWGRDYGWRATIRSEPWHWEYDPDLDKHYNVQITRPTQEDDMSLEAERLIGEIHWAINQIRNTDLPPIAKHAQAAHAAGDLAVAATANITNGVLGNASALRQLLAREGVDVDEQALAAAIAPLLNAATLTALSDTELERIGNAVVDVQHERSARKP